MSKIELNPIRSSYASTSVLNDNFEKIEAGVDDALSRTGKGPNQMESVLDMNKNYIINLPKANQPGMPVTYDQLNPGAQEVVVVPVDTPDILDQAVTYDKLSKDPEDVKNLSDLIEVTQNGYGTVTRPAVEKLKEIQTDPEDFGAAGDGVTDDSLAFDNIRETSPSSLTLNDSTYLYEPKLTGASGSIVVKDLSGKGKVKLKDSTSYVGSASPGDVRNFAIFKLDEDGATSFNYHFDGNGQATYSAYQPAAVNVWFYPIELAWNRKGQKVIGSHLVDAGGHAVESGYQDLSVIALNSATRHNGVASTRGKGLVMGLNTSDDTSDSHYTIHSLHTASFTGNVGTTTSNGGGVDLMGNTNIAAVGNAFSGGSLAGFWIGKSPNTMDLYENVLIAANVSTNNTKYPQNFAGEITVGDYNNLGHYQGKNAFVTTNLLRPTNTSDPSGTTFRPAIWIHPESDASVITNNLLTGKVEPPTNARIRDEGSYNPHIINNISVAEDSAIDFVSFSAQPKGKVVYKGNTGIRLHPGNLGVPTEMRSEDGIQEYSITAPLSHGGLRVLRINYSGGFAHDSIDIEICGTNTTGVSQQKIVARGAGGALTTLLKDTAVERLGDNPPSITVEPGVGFLNVYASAGSAGPSGELFSFYIKIKGPSDNPTRFKYMGLS